MLLIQDILDPTPLLDGTALVLIIFGVLLLTILGAWYNQNRSEQ